ncbi:hypothetical protein E308F_17080 [Moorella sp. E308F]|uniref:hypothetical protein n=1 Tax=unclassified Neomoorella TaxID=2676739 RepID=UPI0010FFB130|nr:MULTISPECIES: hypothetical protein [unclassified Moorella (in: firmicutes)]GEA15464.1 hypothetical protein E308F_17080 [Moorella sp. E308F]GEA19678.1 hypothetical protein E306M_28160 [Moorella sp. E306M]
MIGLAMLILTVLFAGGTFFSFKYRSMLMGAVQRGSERVHQNIQRNPVYRYAGRMGSRGILGLLKEWGPLGEGLGLLWQNYRMHRDVRNEFDEVESELRQTREDIASAQASSAPTFVFVEGETADGRSGRLLGEGTGGSREPVRLAQIGPDTWAYPGIEVVSGEKTPGTSARSRARLAPGVEVRPPWADGGDGDRADALLGGYGGRPVYDEDVPDGGAAADRGSPLEGYTRPGEAAGVSGHGVDTAAPGEGVGAPEERARIESGVTGKGTQRPNVMQVRPPRTAAPPFEAAVPQRPGVNPAARPEAPASSETRQDTRPVSGTRPETPAVSGDGVGTRDDSGAGSAVPGPAVGRADAGAAGRGDRPGGVNPPAGRPGPAVGGVPSGGAAPVRNFSPEAMPHGRGFGASTAANPETPAAPGSSTPGSDSGGDA